MSEELFRKDDVIFRYTLADAERDGLAIRNQWGDSLISHVTIGVWNQYARRLGKGPPAPTVIDVTQLREVIDAAAACVRAALKEKEDEWLVTGIQAPDGKELWAVLNETGKWTLMFPDEY